MNQTASYDTTLASVLAYNVLASVLLGLVTNLQDCCINEMFYFTFVDTSLLLHLQFHCNSGGPGISLNDLVHENIRRTQTIMRKDFEGNSTILALVFLLIVLDNFYSSVSDNPPSEMFYPKESAGEHASVFCFWFRIS